MKEKDTAVKTVGLVMIIMLIGKMTGLFRDSITLSHLGTESIEANAFTYASTIPRNFLDFAFASAISSCFIPVFNSYIEKKGKGEAFKLANNFITIILVISIAITALAMVFPHEIIAFIAPNLNYDTQLLATELLRILLPTIVFSAVAFSITGILQSLGEFNIPASMSIVSNILIITYCLFFMDKYGIYGLAVTFLLGWATQVIIQIPSLLKKGYRYKPHFNLGDKGIKEIGVLVIPVMISAWVLPINSTINLSSVAKLFDQTGRGGSILTAANNLYSVITGVLILSIANVIFPRLSKNVAQDDDKNFGETLKVTIRVLLFLLLPMMAGLITLSKPIVSLFYERNAFDEISTELTANTLMFYSLGMVGFGLQTILSRGFYANRDSKTPLFTGIIAIAINAVLSFSLVDIMGVGGPALATSVAMTVTAGIMLYFMYRKNKNIIDKKMVWDTIKMAIISILMAILVYFSMGLLDNIIINNSSIFKGIKLMLSVGIGVIWYMIISYIFKIDEAKFVFSSISKIFNRRKEG